MASVIKQLEINSGAVQRLTKELNYRNIDVDTEKQRVAKLESEGADEWTVRKQYEVIAEAEKMVPDAKTRLEAGLTDLKALLTAVGDDVPVGNKEKAEAAIKVGETALEGS